jgi:hypothetical protein
MASSRKRVGPPPVLITAAILVADSLVGWAISVWFPGMSRRRAQKRRAARRRRFRSLFAWLMLSVLVSSAFRRWFAKGAAEREALAASLREELDREPTDDEISRRWLKESGYA